MRGWNAELPGEMEKRHEKNRKYSFTLIQAALLIDFSNLTLLWNEFIGARDQAVDYLEEKVKWGTALTPDMITGFVGLQYKYENAAREVKEGIAYLINVEKPDKLSPLLQPHQDP
jgi:hypothetical protein